jgi:hypothetical protein
MVRVMSTATSSTAAARTARTVVARVMEILRERRRPRSPRRARGVRSVEQNGGRGNGPSSEGRVRRGTSRGGGRLRRRGCPGLVAEPEAVRGCRAPPAAGRRRGRAAGAGAGCGCGRWRPRVGERPGELCGRGRSPWPCGPAGCRAGGRGGRFGRCAGRTAERRPCARRRATDRTRSVAGLRLRRPRRPRTRRPRR